MFKLVKKKPKKEISLKDHYERRNKILIKRRSGGFGDILMQRMMFQDFSQEFPEAQITFTCPNHYLEMAKNHPYANAIELESVKEEDYGAIYDISTACRVHETRYGAKNQDHRSDIWSAFCGVRLTNHEMYLEPQTESLKQCKQALKGYNPHNLKTVLLTGQSTNDEFGISKSLTHDQTIEVVTRLREMGYYVFAIQAEKQMIYEQLGIDQFTAIHSQTWIALVSLADYVISVDTATFHMAGGLKKPLVGVFAFTNGKIYGKYYDFVLVQKKMDCGPCFNVSLCPKVNTFPKPCLTDLTAEDILRGFYEAVLRWPSSKNYQTSKEIFLPVHKT